MEKSILLIKITNSTEIFSVISFDISEFIAIIMQIVKMLAYYLHLALGTFNSYES